jgi:hypothetical protein
MFNILTLFSWTTWLIICLVLFAIFWWIWGGKQTYEFVGVKPLQTPEIKFIEDNSSKFNSHDNTYSYERQGNYYSQMKNQNTPKTSKGEDILAEVFEDIIQKKIERNLRPSFLRNPESGKSLELDCYVPEYKLAIEYNGIQHYKFPSAYHKTEKEFYDQLYRDRLKKKLCDEAGVYLIPVPYWVDMCVSDENDPEKLICSKFVSRDIRYQRIYDFLFDKIEEYFSLIFQSEEKDELENEDYDEKSFEENSEQDAYEDSNSYESSNSYEDSNSCENSNTFNKESYTQEEDYGNRWTINDYE